MRIVKGVGVLWIAACGGATPPAPVQVTEPIPVRTVAPCLAPGSIEVPADPRTAKRTRIGEEIARIDRELDAIDTELALAAVPGPQTRDEALVLAASRLQSLHRTSPDAVFADTPLMLVRLAVDLGLAREEDARLGVSYGDRHPERLEQRRVIEGLRAAYDRQRDVEIAEVTAWRAELEQLPKAAPAAKIHQAARRALRATLAKRAGALEMPSDAPAEVRVAATIANEAARQIDVISPELGAKHPEMVLAREKLDEARGMLQRALAAADTSLAREIATLDAPRAQVAIDPARLAHRIELAARARELRREWDALR